MKCFQGPLHDKDVSHQSSVVEVPAAANKAYATYRPSEHIEPTVMFRIERYFLMRVVHIVAPTYLTHGWEGMADREVYVHQNVPRVLDQKQTAELFRILS